MELLNKTELLVQLDFHSTLRDSDINDKDYETHLQDLKTKGFSNRWEYLKYYNINDVEIMISVTQNIIAANILTSSEKIVSIQLHFHYLIF
jgi:hypothetical protein